MTEQLFYRDGRLVPEQNLPKVKLGASGTSGGITSHGPCGRCGGQGGSEAWKFTGYTCYRCGGQNSMSREVYTAKVYTAKRLEQINRAADAKAERAAVRQRAEVRAKRLAFIRWAKLHGKLIGRILTHAKPEGADFISDLAGKLHRHWILSDAQLAAAERVVDAREQRIEQDKASRHVGNIKDRIDFEGIVEFVTYREGHYGTTTIVKFRDLDGNVFTWFASGYLQYNKGDRVQVRGTVKKHDEYKGVKQTVLTRCVVDVFQVMTPDEAVKTDLIESDHIQLIYPERRSVTSHHIFMWHSDAVADRRIEKHTDDLRTAIRDLEDIGDITVAA
jgi:hypothetical protein